MCDEPEASAPVRHGSSNLDELRHILLSSLRQKAKPNSCSNGRIGDLIVPRLKNDLVGLNMACQPFVIRRAYAGIRTPNKVVTRKIV